MFEIRPVQPSDRAVWMQLDPHLSDRAFDRKVRDRMGYLLFADGVPAGLLRYHLFWDNIQFVTLLTVSPAFRRSGCGTALMRYWEDEMRRQNHGMVMTSTQSDETAQHFYRKLGYRDAGCLLLDLPGYAQPTELFFAKPLV